MQATGEQLQQAHRDRTLQLPRREFSEAAIEARRQLIDEAYAVLSDAARRQDYDASFLAKSYDLLEVGRSPDAELIGLSSQVERGRTDPEDIDPYSPNVEIQDEQFVGALLILQELGEYELVLKLGYPYLSGSNPALRQGRFGNPEIIAADIVLAVALACLELGREQWQQGQYENASESLQTGQDVLLQEGLFPNFRGEMQADLYKLRPYRILELVALPESQTEARYRGISLLEDMLQDRGGIDGSGNDQSGLSVDDFLRFIQQLRSYLTAAEQQTLFESEARRPSAVAIYLAVYALLARGFAERQPALIRRAKGMLLRLGTRQDVHLEQAVCSLLLGQTEEASRALELSQEFESLAFIREHSQGSPDLLPGLCLYSERWLQNEVFPYFRNLSRKQASLKEYFADEDVQSYLEELPNEPEATPVRPTLRPSPAARPQAAEPRSRTDTSFQPIGRGGESSFVTSSRATATMDAPNSTEVPETELFSSSPGEGQNGSQPPEVPVETRSPGNRGRRGNGTHPATSTRRGGGSNQIRLDRLLLLAALGVLGLLALGIAFTRLFGDRPDPAVANNPNASSSTLRVQPLSPTLSEVVTPQGQPSIAGTLDETSAATVIQSWLSAKAAAMGQSHEIAQLDTILAEPALSGWRERAEQVEGSNSYWLYEHSNVEIESVDVLSDGAATVGTDTATPETEGTATEGTAAEDTLTSSADPGTTASSNSAQAAIVEATVTERGEFYSNGQIDSSSSYDSTLQVRYNLIQQDGQWQIQSWEVLE